MFYNFSNLSDVSADFTRETYRLLTRFNGLKIKSGYSEKSDAVLFGVIRTREKSWDTVNPTNLRVAQDKVSNSIGDSRQTFYVPGSSEMNLVVHILIIKKPTRQEIELLKSGLMDQPFLNSRIILNQKIPLTTAFNRELLDGSGTQVIGSQNTGVQRRSVENLAFNAAVAIRDIILYAF
jgi:hypothetical protein